ncbi:MAG: iron-containing alcohol dehydrogenase family protein [Myxococcota bacterium]
MIVPTAQVITRDDALEALVELEHLAGARVLLVSDAGLVAAGHVGRAEALLTAHAATVSRHLDVSANPSSDDVDACVSAAEGVDAIVALGGGSVMDVAKLAALIVDTGDPLSTHVGVHETARRTTRLVLIPTTSGTGSEAQAAAIVSDAQTHKKMACLAPGLSADVVLLDPTLTLSCPRIVTAASGLDVIAHAIEVAVTTRRTAKSDALARGAFRRAQAALPRVLEDPSDLGARGEMQRAAYDAGHAIAHSMLGAAHAAGNALTARFGTPHGFAVGEMLPIVVAYNAQDSEVAERYASVAQTAGLGRSVEALLDRLEVLVAQALPSRTHLAADDLMPLVTDAASQWTGTFNPRPMDEDGFKALFEALS